MGAGELWFVGLGLGDERDLGRRAIELLRTADRVVAEEYTAVWAPGGLARLAEEVGRTIERLDRSEVEGESTILASLARGDRVVFLSPGDPFGATTHLALRLAAERGGHAVGYLPHASILTAAPGFLGLIPYRFGRTVSIPFPQPGFAPTSFLDALRSNAAAGLHTLVLLDLDPSAGRFLTADRALTILRERDPAGASLPLDREVAVVARVGRPDAAAWVGPRADLERGDFGPPMHALVVPAPTLHFEEEESLARWRRVPPTRSGRG
ncbi:MAG: diphthine synthase [Thermoplasmata archaeon]